MTMDRDAIKDAEAKVAAVQAALDDAQRVLQAAEKAQKAAEDGAKLMRTVAMAAIAGVVLLALTMFTRRHHHAG
jgi:hypothetical protein